MPRHNSNNSGRSGGRRSRSENSQRPSGRSRDSKDSRGKSDFKKSDFKKRADSKSSNRFGAPKGDDDKKFSKRFPRKSNDGPPSSRPSSRSSSWSESSSANRSTSRFRKDEGGQGEDRRKPRKFEKGPSYGLPFKRSYDKRKRGSDRDEGSGSRSGSESRPRSFTNRSDKDKPRTKRPERRSNNFSKSREASQDTTPPQSDKIRLNKYIANSGVCSRREADELITMGLISVNGKTITELGYKVNPGDEVHYENKVLKAEKPVYILMNKPKGYLTTTDDPQERNTVMHIIGGAVKERIYPVGRLDRNTTGLLLLTNDGDLADKLMHPSYDVKKIYKVELNRPLTQADFQAILEGVRLEEGRAAVDDLAIISEDNKTVGVEIHIGWNRVVRRIFETLGYEVIRLDRSVYAGLDKKDLGRGQWRFLTKEEVVRLKHYR